jgi:predicted acetyltransferase
MDIQLLQAGASDYTIIKNLVPYYVYDISEYMGWDCNDEGRWDGCDELPDYWERSDHHPYLIKVDGRVAGFVLIRPSPGEHVNGSLKLTPFDLIPAVQN